MKLKIAFLTLVAFSLGTSAFACPDFSGEYTQKQCAVTDASKMTPPDLSIEMKTSNSVNITQDSCNSIIVDGDSTYWNMAPKIYLASTIEGAYSINSKSLKSDNDSLTTTYLISSGQGLAKASKKYDIALKKNEDGSLDLYVNVKNRSLLSLGFWRQQSRIECHLTR